MVTLKGYNLDDTIAAISTFPAKAALGVIKISGEKALNIVSKIFLPKRQKDIKKARTYTLHYGWIVEKKDATFDKSSTSFIDEVIVSIMRAPYSYTREDVVEISSHGGITVLNKILELILENGARQALPGEFTYRAFIRGRIDLIQTQAILDIVEAKTYQGLVLSMRNLRGDTSQTINKLKEKTKEIFAYLEACLNFPEEDIELSLSVVKERIANLLEETNYLIEKSNYTEIFRQGLQCVLCGKTNVGKSTLFNRLLKEERAIVTELPGTTRDVIQEEVCLEGVPVRIYDTAGFLKPRDLAEEKAMEKSCQKLDEADLVIFLFDNSRELEEEDLLLLERIKNKEVIFVVNKIDLEKRLDLGKVPLVTSSLIRISAGEGRGVETLQKRISDVVRKRGITCSNDVVLLTQWQRNILKEAKKNLEKTLEFINQGYTIDFVAFSLKEVLDNLGKLTGEVTDEEILRHIFNNFCIGK